jgi:tetratricopeptide (TPR) repeat protein
MRGSVVGRFTRGLRRKRSAWLLPVAVALTLAPDFSPSSGAAAATDLEALHQAVLRDPGNHELTFEFVRVAKTAGDYEAAIGALERLLFYNPDLTRVKYEVGALYYRLGSFEMAAQYFRDALASPNLDAVTRSRVDAYLPQAEKELGPSRWSGFFQTGLRYQSNASFTPSGDVLRLGGRDFLLGPSARRGPDWNWFGIAGLSHDYDLQNQRGDTIETRVLGYGVKQFRFGELDLGFVEATFGPRLALAPDALPGVTIKPYLVGGTAWLDRSRYLSAGGAGLALGIPAGAYATIEPAVEWRRADYDVQNLQPFSSVNSGHWLTFLLNTNWRVTEQVALTARAFYRQASANPDWEEASHVGAEAALKIEFAPPFEIIPRNWSLTPYATYLHTDYEGPNPFIDPARTRRDREWRAGATLDAPITGSFGVSATVQYGRVDSNLPNFRYDNLTVVVGPTARF